MHKTIKAIVSAIGSKKRKNSLQARTGKIPLYGDYWSGGSKTDWFSVNLETMKAERLSGGQNGFFDKPNEIEPNEIEMRQGQAIVRAGVFCGKNATPCIMLHPRDILKIFDLQSFADDTLEEIIMDYLKENGVIY